MMALVGNGCWAEFRAQRGEGLRPCLFLDRDGVVIVDKHHLADPNGVELIPPTVRAISKARTLGWFVGLVTNQSGIGRGLFTWQEFAAVQARIDTLLGSEGIALDFICACPFHEEARPPYDHPDHPWRKPNPGMLAHAIEILGIDPARSTMVGDRASDIEAGRAAGVTNLVLLEGDGGTRPVDGSSSASADLSDLIR
jgi:D-glycero-D-manno-heptose 1,7-bisphosphate phosphatase